MQSLSESPKMLGAEKIENHGSENRGWLRAAVLGANDGLISTASLVIGVASSQANHHAVLMTAVAGLVAGSMSMAAGEYVSVSSQADSEDADLEREKQELATDPKGEHRELSKIYVERGIEIDLAKKVATQLMEKDALGAHARDELGITEVVRARPIQAALASSASFTVGAALPLVVTLISNSPQVVQSVAASSVIFLILLGVAAAKIGDAPVLKGTIRVTVWGIFAMALTAIVGSFFGASV